MIPEGKIPGYTVKLVRCLHYCIMYIASGTCTASASGASLIVPVVLELLGPVHGTLFEKSFLPTGSVKMFRNLSLTCFEKNAKIFRKSKMASTASSPTPRSMTLRGVNS